MDARREARETCSQVKPDCSLLPGAALLFGSYFTEQGMVSGFLNFGGVNNSGWRQYCKKI
jgi:hypothetical protein